MVGCSDHSSVFSGLCTLKIYRLTHLPIVERSTLSENSANFKGANNRAAILVKGDLKVYVLPSLVANP